MWRLGLEEALETIPWARMEEVAAPARPPRRRPEEAVAAEGYWPQQRSRVQMISSGAAHIAAQRGRLRLRHGRGALHVIAVVVMYDLLHWCLNCLSLHILPHLRRQRAMARLYGLSL